MKAVKGKRKKDSEQEVQLKTTPLLPFQAPVQRSMRANMDFSALPREETYKALQFLSDWYNSNQYAGMEHQRGRDSSIPGRHILQTPYGRSRVGNRDVNLERARKLAMNPKQLVFEDNNANWYGAHLPFANEGQGVVIMNTRTLPEGGYKADITPALVHELYHAAEGGSPSKAPEGSNVRTSALVDRRFADVDQSLEAERSRRFFRDEDFEAFASSNPYTTSDWASSQFPDGESKYWWENPDPTGYKPYISEPGEVTARLRQAAFELQRVGLLPKGDFNLTDELLEAYRNMPNNERGISARVANDLLDNFTPEQRQNFYMNLQNGGVVRVNKKQNGYRLVKRDV